MQLKRFLLAAAIGCLGSLPLAIGQDSELRSVREWIVDQPRDFSNEVLFERRGQMIVRSSRFTQDSQLFGDFDGDGDVDQHDYFAMQICLSFSGPEFVTPPACLVFDADTDDDVDLFDAAGFQTAFTGTVAGVLVEAGELVPVVTSPYAYYSGAPGTWGNNALNGIARQAGYSQDDLWYRWTLIGKPENAGKVLISNSALPATAYTVLPSFETGAYIFQLKVTNLVTLEFGFDFATLTASECFFGFDCDDGDPCTVDVCGADIRCTHTVVGGCCNVDADCAAGEICVNNACVPALPGCASDADCDDGDACTDDTCDVVTGECSNYAVVCGIDETCVGGVCILVCTVDADCTPVDACSTGHCVDGACSTASDCNDGLACTDDFCVGDPTTYCSNVSICAAGEQCGANGVCTPGVACTTDADCPDDGVFCNGYESCDATTVICVHAGSPCAEGDTCNEALNACVRPPPINFTLGIDNLSGTAGNDTFNGMMLFNPPTGTNIPSVQTGDAANGGDGTDVLNAQFNFSFGSTTVAPTLTNIETLNITDFGFGAATTLAGAGITGATSLNLSNSTNTNPFIVTNLPTLLDVGISTQAIGATISFVTAATSGLADAMTITLNAFNATPWADTLTLTTGTTNGIEALNLVSNGASRFQDIAMNGTTLTTVNVSGSGNLEILYSLDANVTTINASTATGNVILTATGGGNVTFTGGAGNDTLTLGATYSTADMVNGGAGTGDTLGVDSAAAVAASTAQSNVTNMEALTITNGLAGPIRPTNFGSGVVTTNLLAGFNGGSMTVTSGHAVAAGNRSWDSDSFGAGAVTIGGSGITDSLTLILNDSDQLANTFTGVETLNLVSNGDLDGSAADGAANTGTTLTMVNTAATETLVITGATALTLNGAVTADVINASAFTAAFTMSAVSTGATNVTGGSGNDTLFGTTGADVISGGVGDDTFNGAVGSDIITTGSGFDVVSMVIADVGDIFADFTPGSDDFDWNTALSSTDTSVTTPGAANAYQSGAAGTALAVTTVVFELTGTTVASQTAASVVTALGATATNADTNANILFVVYTTGGGGAIWNWINTDADVEAAELTRVATLSSVTADSLSAGDFR